MTRFSDLLVLLLIVAGLAAVGCDDSTSSGQPDAGCSVDSDCPAGMVCDRFNGLCTLRQAPDVTPLDTGNTDTSAIDTFDAATDGVDTLPDSADAGECLEGESRVCGTHSGVCVSSIEVCTGGAWGPCEAVEPQPEVCDGFDNDCDGHIDETLFQSCGTDVGSCTLGTQSCVNGVWGVCKDAQAPAEESCDGLDNDCDGDVDEDCPCIEGSTQACGNDAGECVAGTQTCSNSVWTPCTDAVGPTAEQCDGLDNDCDGEADEGLSRQCGSTEAGECRFGIESCVAGDWGVCIGAVEPSPEICDAKDNDCDGVIDNSIVRACGSDVGECAAGTQVCASGLWGDCGGQIGSQPEICDDKDNNCDGRIDENLVASCGTTDTGECAMGTQTCSAGTWGGCVGQVDPVDELCDGLDNDCDGTPDDNLTRQCGVTDVGPCQYGTQTCAAGAWGTCLGKVDPAPETCNNADDDCNNLVDDGLTRPCGTTALGVCTMGSESCSAGNWVGCDAVLPGPAEVCTALGDPVEDEDCDGTADEGCACTEGAERSCGVSSVLPCKLGTQTCVLVGSVTEWGPCVGNLDPQAETCNGFDDNCDTIVDGMTQVCGTTDTGLCSLGLETCTAGAWVNCTAVNPAPAEVCDGINDENCDGDVDEGCACVNGTPRSCGTDVGECVAGTETCASGQWGSCVDRVDGTVEVCDGRDNNCDNLIDNIAVGSCNNPPLAVCPPDMATAPLATLTFNGTGSSDPDADPITYAWSVIARPGGSTSAPTPANGSTADFFVDLAGEYTIQLTVSDGEFSNACTFTVTSIPPQDLHVQLIWQEDNGDLDLHLTKYNTTPLGSFYTTGAGGSGADNWWANTPTNWSASLDIDDTNGYGPENINIALNPTNGTYTVGVQLWCDQGLTSRGQTATLVGAKGPKNARVRIYCNGNLVSEIPSATGWRTLTKQDDFWLVGEVNWTGTGANGCTVNTLNLLEGAAKYYTASGVGLRTYQQPALDCNNYVMGCTVQSDCRSWESCYCTQAGGPTGCKETQCRLNKPCNTNADCPTGQTCPAKYKVCTR